MRTDGHIRQNELAGLTIQEIARALGGEVLGGDGFLVPGPAHGPHDRSLRVWLDPTAPDGFRVHSFGRDCDDPLRCRDYVREKLGLTPWRPGVSARPRPRPHPISNTAALEDGTGQRDKARWLWDQSRAASVTLVDYLASRGIRTSHVPTTLRYVPPRPPKHPYAAMLAAFALAHEPEPGRLAVSRQAITGVHLTRLRVDGRGKAGTDRDKIMVGPSLGTPIVLAPPNDNLGLAIAEGIESALSVHVATGLGVWAAGSASRMPHLAQAVPGYTEIVTIVADGDEVGQRNAHLLAERLFERGIAVDIKTVVGSGEGVSA